MKRRPKNPPSEENLSKLESVVLRSGIFLVILFGVLTGIYLAARSFVEESNGLDVGVMLFITALFVAFVVITVTGSDTQK